MLSINWRRGLFRLWIAASIVWLVGAGAILQEGVRRNVSALLSDVPQPGSEREELTLSEREELTLSEREELTLRRKLKQGGLSPKQESDIRRRLDPGWIDFAAELRKSPAELAEEKRQEDRARQVRAAPGQLMISASLLLLPPILLFALGWAGLWIMRGFRS